MSAHAEQLEVGAIVDADVEAKVAEAESAPAKAELGAGAAPGVESQAAVAQSAPAAVEAEQAAKRPAEKPRAADGGAAGAALGNPQWRKYPSINDVDLEQVAKVAAAARESGEEFVALEKVHGSNFAFETDGSAIAYFSRNRRLAREESFVGKVPTGLTMDRYRGSVLRTYELCSAAAAAAGQTPPRSVLVYGEYFGGWYPSRQVKQEGPGAGTAVQKGIVAYAPAHHFFAFDLCVDGTFMDYDQACCILTSAGFPMVAQPIVRGTFDECMGFDVESLRTTIPGMLGLPVLEEWSIAEGLVIKPVRPCAWMTVKKKSVRYLEAVPAELGKWLRKCVADQNEAAVGLYLCLCRRPRLDSVLSKEPQLRRAGLDALTRVQHLYREDVEEAMVKRLSATGLPMPKERAMVAPRAAADRLVAQWLGGA